jgi:hypothetical protein
LIWENWLLKLESGVARMPMTDASPFTEECIARLEQMRNAPL